MPRCSAPWILGLLLVAASACPRSSASTTPEPLASPTPPEPEPAPEPQPEPEPEPRPEPVMATVGDVDIPMSAFDAIYQLKVGKYHARGREVPASADRRYRKSISERLIYQQVLAQHIAQEDFDFDPVALEQRTQQQRRGIRDWAKHLERRGETDASLHAMLVAEYRENALLEHAGRLEVTEAEIDADYEKIKDEWKSSKRRVRASHILVRIGPKLDRGAPDPTAEQTKAWTAQAKAKAKQIHAEAIAPGADFAALARTHSTGPSALKGGDIGIFTADRMVAEFSAVAFSMKVGAISKPVKTKFGFHIIKVTGRWRKGLLPREALADSIRSRLRQRKLHQGRRELKTQLLDAATIVDNIAPTLGPEPRRGRKRSPSGEPVEDFELDPARLDNASHRPAAP